MEFTKEQLIEHINGRKEFADECAADSTLHPERREYYELTAEALRIALASLESEPVAYLTNSANMAEVITSHHFGGDSVSMRRVAESSKWKPLFTAPPAPAVPDAIPKLKDGQRFKYVKDGIRYSANYANGWNAFRAAMLQGADGTLTNEGTIPANTPCKEAPEHIWLQTAGVWPENGEFSELTWCSDNQHEDDTLYVRADVGSGNSPVIPDGYTKAADTGIPIESDGWVACSERMPSPSTGVIVAAPWQSAPGGYAMKWATNCPGHPDADADGWIIPGASWRPTHWMPLPAAPKQEVK